jgi:hypothetical protein
MPVDDMHGKTFDLVSCESTPRSIQGACARSVARRSRAEHRVPLLMIYKQNVRWLDELCCATKAATSIDDTSRRVPACAGDDSLRLRSRNFVERRGLRPVRSTFPETTSPRPTTRRSRLQQSTTRQPAAADKARTGSSPWSVCITRKEVP